MYKQENKSKGQRVAIAISKKEEKTAVGRNRIRRRVRHATLKILKDNHIRQDIFIVARGGVKATPWSELLGVCESCILKR